MNGHVLHLPNGLTRAEKAEPEAVKLSRDIPAFQALEMIRNQQGKIVRLLMALNEVENRMHQAQERSMKATAIAARHAAQSKEAQEKYVKLLREFAAEREQKNDLAEKLTILGRIIVKLMDIIHWIQPVACPYVTVEKSAFVQDGRILALSSDEHGNVVLTLQTNDGQVAEPQPCSQF